MQNVGSAQGRIRIFLQRDVQENVVRTRPHRLEGNLVQHMVAHKAAQEKAEEGESEAAEEDEGRKRLAQGSHKARTRHCTRRFL